MNVNKIFTEEKTKRVEAAIQRAESRTSGEIVPLVVNQSDAYPHLEFVGGLLGQFLALLAAIWVLPQGDYLKLFGILALGFFSGYLLFPSTVLF